MRRGSPIHFRAAWLLLCALACAGATISALAQSSNAQVTDLLRKAHAAETRGRMDMAKETWQQVLLSDPNNAEALAGMARAAKSAGNQAESDEYLRRLRTVSPNSPAITQVENTQSTQAKSRQLQEAGRLAQSGQYGRAMDIQRQVYGTAPPDGEQAIGYYQTEASTPQGRVAAAAGLRSLAAKYPQDSRYQIALGKVLTYNPRTRGEGRRILERYPYDQGALQAIHDSLGWDVQNPAAAREIRAYLSQHPDPQLEAQLQDAESHRPRGGGRGGRPLTPEQRAEQAAFAARSSEERAAYAALNAHKYAEADALFRAILANHPQSCQALSGLGYVRMSQSNFAGAISFLEQAEQDGCKSPAFERALHDSRFFYTVQVATTALNDNDLFTAQKEFELALKLRPDDSSALLGLGGTLLKAQQPEQAMPVFADYVKHAPGDMRAWRGLIMAEYGAGKYKEALDTERRIPPPVKAELIKDPDYMRTLASVYLAEGREADAQRIFQQALALPFPNGGKGLKVDVQLQYAALLASAGRREQAALLYKQVLEVEPTNMNAWVGLIQVEHQLGHDAEAYRLAVELQEKAPQVYAGAMQEAGFQTSLAAIYEGASRDDLAQVVLENLIAKRKLEGKKPFISAEVQLAAIYVRRGNPAQAYALYRAVLAEDPDRADAWVGVLSSLHSTDHDQEALAQLQQIPPAIRAQLEKDPSYLQIVGSIYSSTGDTRQAAYFFNRVQQHYAAEHMPPPADVQIQQAWMLYNAGADAALYRQLMLLGGRQDLTDRQRLTVQTIWTNWAVKRANQNVAAGNYRRAIMILNATAKTFPGNPEVIKALASGYASAGMTKEAIAIFRAENLSNAPVTDYRAAIGAALAGNDLHDAELWLRFGLERYPRDPQLLLLAAKFETSRGDANRAADYYKASLRAMPVVDPGAQLAAELNRPAPPVPAALPSENQPQDLATLLSQPDQAERRQMQMAQHPYLPSYNQPSVDVPVPMGGSAPAYGAPYGSSYGSPQPGIPAPTTFPDQPAPYGQPAMPPQDFVPQAGLNTKPLAPAKPQEEAVLHLHASPAMEAKYGPYVSYDPSAGVPHFTSTPRALGDGVLITASADAQPVTARMQQTAYQQQTTDGTTQYPPQGQVPQPAPQTSKPITQRQSPKARAAAIHLNQQQGQSGLAGQSHPPAEIYQPYNGSGLSNAQFSSQPYDPAQMQGGQVAQPQAAPRTTAPAPQQTFQQPAYQQPQVTGVPDTNAQQYPQPGTGPTTGAAPVRTRRRAAKPVPSSPAPSPGPAYGPAPMNYPAPPAQPLGSYGAPQVSGQYPLGQPPSDYDLQQQNLPPLRGYYDPRGEEHQPLTQRQQAELALEGIEGSYSGWAGMSAIGHYRSGTPGVDRLASLEIPVEVSLVAGRTIRLSIIPKAVFLNNGQLDTQGGSLGTTPILGSLNGTALFNPAQQFASGVGGEVQLATRTFSVAVGTTPYEFLVTNMIGRRQSRPGNSHVTLYGGRDPVKETMLSYAGMRDPASATLNYSGNVWGGVVNTGGGARLDFGGEKSGLYLVGEGGYLTGFHVQDNRKFDGTMGAYFRVASWPEYGSLNIGGLVYGEHFAHNERANTYGLGGYFSPEAYFLAAVPITFNGHYGPRLHYFINSSLGVQTFEEDNGSYFPLDPSLQTAAYTACVNAAGSIVPLVNRNCGQQPVNSSTGMNYALDSEVSYQFSPHWYVGGFLSANNTNNYNSVTGGFFARYTFKPQVSAPDYPTGLFPVEGSVFRPLQVP